MRRAPAGTQTYDRRKKKRQEEVAENQKTRRQEDSQPDQPKDEGCPGRTRPGEMASAARVIEPRGQESMEDEEVLGNARGVMLPIHGENGLVYTKQEKAQDLVGRTTCPTRMKRPYPPSRENSPTYRERTRPRSNTASGPGGGQGHSAKTATEESAGVRQDNQLDAEEVTAQERGSADEHRQHVLRLRRFPKRWKKADVMTPKPGKDLKFPSSYRPISPLPEEKS